MSTAQYGGVIYMQESVEMNITGTATNGGIGIEFANNTADASGGAISSWGSSVTVSVKGLSNMNGIGVAFTENNANYGGAIYNQNGTLTIAGTSENHGDSTGVWFDKNTANYGGGVICVYGGLLTIDGTSYNGSDGTGVVFQNSAARWNGGAIFAWSDTQTLIITGESTGNGAGVLFVRNTAAEQYGGAIYAEGSNMEINVSGMSTGNGAGAIFSENESVAGGAIFTSGTSLTLTGTSDSTGTGIVFDSNSVTKNGGVIYSQETELTLTGTSNGAGTGVAFQSNIATEFGGVLFVSGSTSLTNITGESNGDGMGLIFSKNESTSGGAIYVSDGKMKISGENNGAGTGMILIENEAISGDALYIVNSEVIIDGGTLTGNKTIMGPGDLVSPGGAIASLGISTLIIGENNETKIIGNATTTYGGGIYSIADAPYGSNENVLIFGENALIYDNMADTAGDDLYAYSTALVKLSDANMLFTGVDEAWIWDPEGGPRSRIDGPVDAYNPATHGNLLLSLVWAVPKKAQPPEPPESPKPPAPGPNPSPPGTPDEQNPPDINPNPVIPWPGSDFLDSEWNQQPVWVVDIDEQSAAQIAAIGQRSAALAASAQKAHKRGVVTPIQRFPAFLSGNLDSSASFDLLKVTPGTDDALLRWIRENDMWLDEWIMTLGETDQPPGFQGKLTVRIRVGKERAGDVLYVLRYIEGAYELTECVVDKYGMISYATDRLGHFLLLHSWDSLYEGLDAFIRENEIPNSGTESASLAPFGISAYDLEMMDALHNKLYPVEPDK